MLVPWRLHVSGQSAQAAKPVLMGNSRIGGFVDAILLALLGRI
jgi:hypothetical protein